MSLNYGNLLLDLGEIKYKLFSIHVYILYTSFWSTKTEVVIKKKIQWHEAEISPNIRNPYGYCTGCPYFCRKRLHWWEGFVVTVWARWTPSRWSWRGRGTPPPVAPSLWTWVISSSTLCSQGRWGDIYSTYRSTVSVMFESGRGGGMYFEFMFHLTTVNSAVCVSWDRWVWSLVF